MDVFLYVDRRYTKSFPDSVKNQAKLVNGRQKMEYVPLVTDNLKSVEMSSARYGGSATTQPNTHHIHSAASHSTNYGTMSSAECYKSSSGRIYEESTEIKKVKAISVSNLENESIHNNI